jgi:hypothetical protein
MADVFFCYYHKDLQAAEHWSRRLEAAGISVWLDPRGAQGTVWTQEIVQAIEECSVMIVLLSRGGVNSHNVVKEVSLASERGKSIIPVKLEPVEIPSTMQYQLGRLTAVELYESLDVPKIEQAKADALLSALAKHGLAVPEVESEEPPPAEPEETPQKNPAEEAELQAEDAVPAGRLKSWKQFQQRIVFLSKKYWLATRFYARRTWAWYRALNQKAQIGVGAGVGAMLLLLILWIGWPESGKKGTGFDASALPEDQLALAAQRVNLQWQKGGFGGIEGQKQDYGVAGVYRKRSGKLYMVTQSSAVDLEEMAKSEKNPPLRIKQYRLWSLAVSNCVRQAERFAFWPGKLDLAVLEVNAYGMKAGEDYVLLPYRPGADLDEDDEVILFHWIPREGDFVRQTPERITGRRTINVDGRDISLRQVGSGHKTGLVMKKDGEGYFWVGVIAYHDGDASYAILPADFLKLDPKFYLANRDGAAQAIRENLDVDAVGKD